MGFSKQSRWFVLILMSLGLLLLECYDFVSVLRSQIQLKPRLSHCMRFCAFLVIPKRFAGEDILVAEIEASG
jgi:hypothetical protein